ncbi:hypothetical protein [Clostridium sp.]|uniref:hypothetical protein n=1 Tax=Clostridium sp. TaxID=1506 RepID=UPI001A57D007|nr:hypothetical protein [Clostridium sp.]MBK5236353.1 hypothetical protein [Clostridium sp.]
MLIDDDEIFDTNKDKLDWTKVITISPLDTNSTKSTHIIRYYKTESEEEYYIFEYIIADNNGLMVDNFDGYHWKEIIKQINFPDHCFIYSQSVNDKNCFRFVTSGMIIKKYVQDYIEDDTRIYELEHH